MDLIGVIGGTGLDQWGGLEREYSGETPYGSTSAPLAAYDIGKTTLVFIARHGHQHNIPPHKVNYRANLHALHQAGVKRVVAVNAVMAVYVVAAAVWPEVPVAKEPSTKKDE